MRVGAGRLLFDAQTAQHRTGGIMNNMFDVCVMRSGPAGGVVSKELAEAGAKVALVEVGREMSGLSVTRPGPHGGATRTPQF